MPPVIAAGLPALLPMMEPPFMPIMTESAVMMNTAIIGTDIPDNPLPAIDIEMPTASASILSATPANMMFLNPLRF